MSPRNHQIDTFPIDGKKAAAELSDPPQKVKTRGVQEFTGSGCRCPKSGIFRSKQSKVPAPEAWGTQKSRKSQGGEAGRGWPGGTRVHVPVGYHSQLYRPVPDPGYTLSGTAAGLLGTVQGTAVTPGPCWPERIRVPHRDAIPD